MSTTTLMMGVAPLPLSSVRSSNAFSGCLIVSQFAAGGGELPAEVPPVVPPPIGGGPPGPLIGGPPGPTPVPTGGPPGVMPPGGGPPGGGPPPIGGPPGPTPVPTGG